MHPFALTQDDQQQVHGGIAPSHLISLPFLEDGEVITQALNETGGPIYVTMAIPEDGDDPRLSDLFYKTLLAGA